MSRLIKAVNEVLLGRAEELVGELSAKHNDEWASALAQVEAAEKSVRQILVEGANPQEFAGYASKLAEALSQYGEAREEAIRLERRIYAPKRAAEMLAMPEPKPEVPAEAKPEVKAEGK